MCKRERERKGVRVCVRDTMARGEGERMKEEREIVNQHINRRMHNSALAACITSPTISSCNGLHIPDEDVWPSISETVPLNVLRQLHTAILQRL